MNDEYHGTPFDDPSALLRSYAIGDHRSVRAIARARLLGSLVLLTGVGAWGCSSDTNDAADAAAANVDAGKSCEQLQQQVQASLAPTLDSASANLSCASDDDCALIGDIGTCSVGCGLITNSAGASAVQAALAASASFAACTQFVAQGCALVIPPCYSPGPGAACDAGSCTSS